MVTSEGMNGEQATNGTNSSRGSLKKVEGFSSPQSARSSLNKETMSGTGKPLHAMIPRNDPLLDDSDTEDVPTDEEEGGMSPRKIRRSLLTYQASPGSEDATPKADRRSFIIAHKQENKSLEMPTESQVENNDDDDDLDVSRKSIEEPQRQKSDPNRRRSHKPPRRHLSAPCRPGAKKPNTPVRSAVKSPFRQSAFQRSSISSETTRQVGPLNIPAAFRPDNASDDQSVGVHPSILNARKKFAAMPETPDLNQSCSSFVTELPPMPRRSRGATQTIVRGGRVIKIEKSSSTNDRHFTAPHAARRTSNDKPTGMAGVVGSTEETTESGEDQEIIENLALALEDGRKSGSSWKRSESGSSHDVSIPTYEDENDRNADEPIQDIQELGLNDDIVLFNDDDVVGADLEYEPLNDGLEFAHEFGENGDVFVVDKVPKKRWSSKNLENFPVWPPVIKVQTWQKRNVSGISIGSGFTPESNLPCQDVMSSLGDDDSMFEDEEEFTRAPPARKTSYRIRYDGPTSLALSNVYNLPPVPRNDSRFEPTSRPPDGAPSMPARRDADSVPSAPHRAGSLGGFDELSVDLDEVIEQSRPDVWITPLASSQREDAMWKVRRVWAVDAEDEKEEEHDVMKTDLFDKIKTLVGAPKPDDAPKMPTRSWHVQTVVENKGYIKNVGTEKDLDDDEFSADLESMAKDAVEEIKYNEKALEERKQRWMERKEEMAKQGGLGTDSPIAKDDNSSRVLEEQNGEIEISTSNVSGNDSNGHVPALQKDDEEQPTRPEVVPAAEMTEHSTSDDGIVEPSSHNQDPVDTPLEQEHRMEEKSATREEGDGSSKTRSVDSDASHLVPFQASSSTQASVHEDTPGPSTPPRMELHRSPSADPSVSTNGSDFLLGSPSSNGKPTKKKSKKKKSTKSDESESKLSPKSKIPRTPKTPKSKKKARGSKLLSSTDYPSSTIDAILTPRKTKKTKALLKIPKSARGSVDDNAILEEESSTPTDKARDRSLKKKKKKAKDKKPKTGELTPKRSMSKKKKGKLSSSMHASSSDSEIEINRRRNGSSYDSDSDDSFGGSAKHPVSIRRLTDMVQASDSETDNSDKESNSQYKSSTPRRRLSAGGGAGSRTAWWNKEKNGPMRASKRNLLMTRPKTPPLGTNDDESMVSSSKGRKGTRTNDDESVISSSKGRKGGRTNDDESTTSSPKGRKGIRSRSRSRRRSRKATADAGADLKG